MLYGIDISKGSGGQIGLRSHGLSKSSGITAARP